MKAAQDEARSLALRARLGRAPGFVGDAGSDMLECNNRVNQALATGHSEGRWQGFVAGGLIALAVAQAARAVLR